MRREYCTVGAGLERFRSSMRLIQFSISLGFFSACSMDRTSIGCRSWFLLRDLSCRSRIEGSVGFSAGSSRRVDPRPLGWPSGRGILMKASTSPMLGMSSGMNGFSAVSSSMVWGLYRVMYWKSSSTSDETFMFLNSSGLYAFAGTAALLRFSSPSPPSPLESEVLVASLLLDSPLSLPSSSSPPEAWGLPPESPGDFSCGCPRSPGPCGDLCELGEGASELAGVLTSSSSVSTGMASSYARSDTTSSWP
mmetsp:Transcript_80898/g.229023  ORF Transcript_80898/g.229023 Transcript_80898/m.229023 type:complete len:250 (+) Transcript_80898:469-1218(+)